jgi:hypothetical protein
MRDRGGGTMADLLMIVLTVVFFAIAVGYVAACDRLGQRR